MFCISQAVMVTAFVGGLLYVFRVSGATSRAAMSDLTKLTEKSLIALTRLNPHVVDPQTFGPSGMARADEEKQQAAAEKAAASALVGEQEDARLLREAEELWLARNPERPAASRGNPSPRTS